MTKIFQLVIGCGECGTRLSQLFYQKLGYHSIALNFNKDTEDENEHIKIIQKGGTGRKKALGRMWFNEHEKVIIDFVNKNIEKVEIEQKIKVQDILIISGESGGAGSSISEELRKRLSEKFNIFLLSVMPSQDEGAIFRSESLKSLKRIREELNEDIIKGVFLISNEHVSKLYNKQLPPDKEFNDIIINNFIEIFKTINNKELDFSRSYKFPDAGDFSTVLKLPIEILNNDNNRGFFDIRKFKFSKKNVIENSVFFENIDISTTKAYFGILKIPREQEINVGKMFKEVDKRTSCEIPFKIVYYDETIEEPEMYVFLSGANISKKLINEIQKIAKSKQTFNDKIAKSKQIENDVFDKL